MPTKTATTSIFTDDSGTRKRTVTAAIRGAVGLIGLGVAAVAVSVFGHVTLPGLEAPLHLPGINSTNPATKGTEPGNAGSTQGNLSTGTLTGTTPTAGNPASTAQPTAPNTPCDPGDRRYRQADGTHNTPCDADDSRYRQADVQTDHGRDANPRHQANRSRPIA